MSKAYFGDSHDPTVESELKHIHIPVIIESNYLGAEPIYAAEPWVVFDDRSLGAIRLLWQNENDSEGPIGEITLRAGRTYQIPFIARSFVEGFPLYGKAVMLLPATVSFADWSLGCGIPRITNGAHYYTFYPLINLRVSNTYSIILQIRQANGKVLLAKQYFLHVPYTRAKHEEFYLY